MLADRIRSRWTDHCNTARFATRRMVKTVAATNLLPWFHEHFPDVRVIFAVRHPFAFAESHVALDWPLMDRIHAELVAGADAVIDALPRGVQARARSVDLWPSDPFETFVVRWCLENATQLHSPTPGVLRLHDERLVLDPRTELDRVGAHLATSYGDDVLGRSGVPSSTDFRHSVASEHPRSPDALVSGWTARVDRARRDQGLRVLDAFGLDAFGLDAFGLVDVYDASPVPAV